MTSLSKSLGTILISVAAFCACDSPPLTPEEAWEVTQAEVMAQMADEPLPGVAVAIILDGQVAYAQGFGLLAADQPGEVNPDSMFHLFSVSKGMTAAAIMSAVEDNTLALDQPVSTYVPMVTFTGDAQNTITLHDMLTHTSGIPDDNPILNPGWGKCTETGAEHWHQDRGETWTPAGEVFLYSNDGFNLAGHALAMASGNTFEQEMQTRLFDQLGMTRTTFDPATAISWGNAASPHTKEFGTGDPKPEGVDSVDCDFENPAMGVMTSVNDLAKYARMLLGQEQILSASSLDLLRHKHFETRRKPNEFYGYGLYNKVHKGVTILQHTGRGVGSKAMMTLAPEQNFGVLVLLNSGNADAYRIAETAIDAFLDLSGENELVMTAPDTWDEYTGAYNSTHWIGNSVVTRDDDELVAFIRDNGIEVRMTQESGDAFIGDILGTEVDGMFWRDDSGNVKYVLTRAGVGTKVD